MVILFNTESRRSLDEKKGHLRSPFGNSLDLITASGNFEPYFTGPADREITAPSGGQAYLRCQVMQLGDRTVRVVREESRTFIYHIVQTTLYLLCDNSLTEIEDNHLAMCPLTRSSSPRVLSSETTVRDIDRAVQSREKSREREEEKMALECHHLWVILSHG